MRGASKLTKEWALMKVDGAGCGSPCGLRRRGFFCPNAPLFFQPAVEG